MWLPSCSPRLGVWVAQLSSGRSKAAGAHEGAAPGACGKVVGLVLSGWEQAELGRSTMFIWGQGGKANAVGSGNSAPGAPVQHLLVGLGPWGMGIL